MANVKNYSTTGILSSSAFKRVSITKDTTLFSGSGLTRSIPSGIFVQQQATAYYSTVSFVNYNLFIFNICKNKKIRRYIFPETY